MSYNVNESEVQRTNTQDKERLNEKCGIAFIYSRRETYRSLNRKEKTFLLKVARSCEKKYEYAPLQKRTQIQRSII